MTNSIILLWTSQLYLIPIFLKWIINSQLDKLLKVYSIMLKDKIRHFSKILKICLKPLLIIYLLMLISLKKKKKRLKLLIFSKPIHSHFSITILLQTFLGLLILILIYSHQWITHNSLYNHNRRALANLFSQLMKIHF